MRRRRPGRGGCAEQRARHLHTFEPDADAASTTLQLDQIQARTLGAILGGVYFEPAGGDHDAPAVFGAVAIDWLTVETDTPAMSVEDLGSSTIPRRRWSPSCMASTPP